MKFSDIKFGELMKFSIMKLRESMKFIESYW